MRVGLMLPCYIDMFYPQVGAATVELLEKLGVEVDYPFDQTCCGQPMANSGAYREAKATEELFVRNFAEYEYIVAPPGSCVHHPRNKFTAAGDTPERRHVSSRVWDLPEFLCDVLQGEGAEFPHQVAQHASCSAIRGLYEQSMSERERPDECCGFGGTFSVTEEAVSAAMGNDKLKRIGATGARYMWASQRGASTAAFDTPPKAAAWETIPSWYFISSGDHPSGRRSSGMGRHTGRLRASPGTRVTLGTSFSQVTIRRP